MNLQKTKILRTLAKGVLVLTGLFLLGVLGLTVYKGIKFRPYKVRVTNVTDSAFTVSWVTDSPMPGIVYFGEKNSFLPGPLAWLGKKKAVDDRDYADAQGECVSKFNEEASKNKDENFTIDASRFDCNDIKVWKYGKYYTHHVTVQNLDAEKEYFFRVGDGLISYAKNSGEFVVGEIEGLDEFSTKTSPLFNEVLAPNPAYGTTETVYKTSDGFYSYEKDYDSMVFLSIEDSDGVSFPTLSSVANNDGGWSIDLSNLRDIEGKPANIDGKTMIFMPQSKNHNSFVFQEFEYGKVVFPLRLPGNAEENLQVEKVGLTSNLISKLIYKNEAYDAGCVATGIYGRKEYCGDQCYRKWTRGSEVCGWEKVSSGCSSKPCTCPGENCNPPAPEPPAPTAPTCPIYGSPIISDFTTVCHQNTCTCTNSLAKSTSIKCGNKCEKNETTCTSGKGSLADLFSVCKFTNCSCTHTDSDKNDVSCGSSCKRKTTTCSANWGTWRVTTGDTECENLTSQCNKEQCTPLCYTESVCKALITHACANTGASTISDFTTVCNRDTCACTNAFAKSSSVTCGKKCEKKAATCPADWGTYRFVESTGKCQSDSSCKIEDCTGWCYSQTKCDSLNEKLYTCPCTIFNGDSCVQTSDCDSCKKLRVSDYYYSSNEACLGEHPTTPTPPPATSQCYFWSGGLGALADGTCIAATNTSATNCKGNNYYLNDPSCGGKAGYYTFNYLNLSKSCYPCGPLNINAYTSFGNCEKSRKQIIKDRDSFVVGVIDLGVFFEKVGHVNYEGTNYLCCPYSKNGDNIVKNKQFTTVNSCMELLSLKEQEGEKSTFLDISECSGLPMSQKGFESWGKLSFTAMAEGESNDTVLYLPEAGIYTVKFSKSEAELSLLGGENKKYLFFENRDGVEGYQSPTDPQNPKENEDILITQTSVVLSVSQETTAKKISLKRGINIISFNFLPSAANEEKKMNSSEFLKLVNESDFNVSRISYFAAGQWNGGVTYDIETNETKGVPFDLVFGKGYVVIAEQDCTISIPGYNIESAVPIAFSSGWNLVGVHGYSEAYTAKTFIESINTIEGLKANNVTWWPTSRGMYQGYQLQNGQEYGQDFPISPINGYFVRIAEFTPKEDTCKSLIWNPSGEMNGECGSNN